MLLGELLAEGLQTEGNDLDIQKVDRDPSTRQQPAVWGAHSEQAALPLARPGRRILIALAKVRIRSLLVSVTHMCVVREVLAGGKPLGSMCHFRA